MKARRKPGGTTRSEHDSARRERGLRRISQRRGLRADGCRACRAFAGGCFPLCATSERSSSRGALGNKRRSCAFVIGTALSTCASCPSSTHLVCTRAFLSVLRAGIVSWPAPLDPASLACLPPALLQRSGASRTRETAIWSWLTHFACSFTCSGPLSPVPPRRQKKETPGKSQKSRTAPDGQSPPLHTVKTPPRPELDNPVNQTGSPTPPMRRMMSSQTGVAASGRERVRVQRPRQIFLESIRTRRHGANSLDHICSSPRPSLPHHMPACGIKLAKRRTQALPNSLFMRYY